MLGSSTDRICTPSTSAGPFRILAVSGYEHRANDIVYCPPTTKYPTQNVEESTAIVYFGGDVQDFPESMETNKDSRGYIKYNLENSAISLREAFPRSHIIVIRPVRMEFKTFSCFDNFVRGNSAGVPDHTPMHNALQHLERLLQNLSQRLISMSENEILAQVTTSTAGNTTNVAMDSTSNNDNSQDMDIDILQIHDNITVDNEDSLDYPCNTETNTTHTKNDTSRKNTPTTTCHESEAASSTAENNCQQQNNAQYSDHQNDQRNLLWWRENLNLDRSKLVLIGFSKGCVVLNQFIYEFHYLKTLTPDDSSMIRLLSRIKDMYWLDGGHGGQKNTWITSRSLLETLTRMGINIHVHLTPYQVQDDRRPWIRKEEKIFSDMLRRLGAPITRRLHYESQTTNLMTHFEVIHAFCQHIHDFNQHQQQQNSQQQHPQQQHQNAHNQAQTHSIIKSGTDSSLDEK